MYDQLEFCMGACFSNMHMHLTKLCFKLLYNHLIQIIKYSPLYSLCSHTLLLDYPRAKHMPSTSTPMCFIDKTVFCSCSGIDSLFLELVPGFLFSEKVIGFSSL